MSTLTADRRRTALLLSALLALFAVGLALVSPIGAEGASEEAEPAPIEATLLTADGHHLFPDDVAVQVRDRPDGRSTDVINLRDASRLATAEIVIQPGAAFPWHTHPGPVLAAVAEGDAEGAFVYVYGDDCVERPYEVGEAFIDPGGSVHSAYNPSETQETVVIATFLDVAEAEGLTQPIRDAHEAEEFNDSCGLDAPVPDQE